MAKYDKIAKKISKQVTKQVTKKLTKKLSKIIVASLDWQKIIGAKTSLLEEDKPQILLKITVNLTIFLLVVRRAIMINLVK